MFSNSRDMREYVLFRRDRHMFAVEDPLDVTHDLGSVCDKQALYIVRGEFMRADDCFKAGQTWEDVMEPFLDEWRGS